MSRHHNIKVRRRTGASVHRHSSITTCSHSRRSTFQAGATTVASVPTMRTLTRASCAGHHLRRRSAPLEDSTSPAQRAAVVPRFELIVIAAQVAMTAKHKYHKRKLTLFYCSAFAKRTAENCMVRLYPCLKSLPNGAATLHHPRLTASLPISAITL